MKRKISMVLLTAAFLAVLFSPHIVWGLFSEQLEIESSEKRTLASLPDFAIETIEEYPKSFEAYYNDHLPFRNHLIRLYNSLQVHLFRTSSHENVILGEDGWLFYASRTDGTTMECYDGSMLFSDEELKRIEDSLVGMQERLAEQGIEFVLFIAPNKERMYSEYLPAYLGEQAEECMLNQVLDHLKAHTSIRVVYPYEELIAYKQAHPEQNLYYKTDTHWNDLGGYIGARALLSEIGIDIAPLDQLDTVSADGDDGDLTGMLNAAGLMEKGFSKRVITNSPNHVQALEENFDGRMEYTAEGAPQKKVFIRRDSFCTAMIPYLRENLSHSIFTHYSRYDAQQVWDEKPDVFVLEIVERYIRWLRSPVL